MDFSELLQRANLNSIESYLLYGVENHEPPSEKTYAQRIDEAEKQATAFFQARYSDYKEYDEIAGYFNAKTAVYEDVYFEIGLLLGAKIAYQIKERMAQLD